MHSPLSIAIAKQLAGSNVGFFRKQLFDKIDNSLCDGKIDKISSVLNSMLDDGHVQKSPCIGLDGSRWSLTPRGRASYSQLNEEQEQSIERHSEKTIAPADESPLSDETPAVILSIDENDDEWENRPDKTALINFNLTDTLDRALYGLVKLIRDVAHEEPEPICIEHKESALELLETMETNELINGSCRATFARIRQAVEQMDGV